MKTKLLLLATLLNCGVIFSQSTNYYNSREVKGKDITYNIEQGKFIILSNAKNHLYLVQQYDYNGNFIDISSLGSLLRISNPQVIDSVAKSLFTIKNVQSFNNELKEIKNELKEFNARQIKNFTLSIYMYVNMQGRVLELTFEFLNLPSTRKINPEKFEELEQSIKNQVKFDVPAERLKPLKFVQASRYIVDFSNW